MTNGNSKKQQKLGMPFGTANARLRKKILFHLLEKHKENFCFHCRLEIKSVDELSIEHKEAWLYKDISLFWDMDNIAFSHLSCNCRASSRRKGKVIVHGTRTGYQYGCKCKKCSFSNAIYIQNNRNGLVV